MQSESINDLKSIALDVAVDVVERVLSEKRSPKQLSGDFKEENIMSEQIKCAIKRNQTHQQNFNLALAEFSYTKPKHISVQKLAPVNMFL